jgi:hypothetical protein
MKGGAAKTYHGVTDGMKNLRDLFSEALPTLTDATDRMKLTAAFTETVEDGQELQRVLLEHLHKEAAPGKTPDLLAIHGRYQAWGNQQVPGLLDWLMVCVAEQKRKS